MMQSWIDDKGNFLTRPVKGARLIPHRWSEMFQYDGVDLTCEETLRLASKENWKHISQEELDDFLK
jgi:hypothetical protein